MLIFVARQSTEDPREDPKAEAERSEDDPKQRTVQPQEMEKIRTQQAARVLRFVAGGRKHKRRRSMRRERRPWPRHSGWCRLLRPFAQAAAFEEEQRRWIMAMQEEAVEERWKAWSGRRRKALKPSAGLWISIKTFHDIGSPPEAGWQQAGPRKMPLATFATGRCRSSRGGANPPRCASHVLNRLFWVEDSARASEGPLEGRGLSACGSFCGGARREWREDDELSPQQRIRKAKEEKAAEEFLAFQEAMALNAEDKRKAHERRLMDQRGTLDLFNSEPKRRRKGKQLGNSAEKEAGGGFGDQIGLTSLAHHLEGLEGEKGWDTRAWAAGRWLGHCGFGLQRWTAAGQCRQRWEGRWRWADVNLL